MDLSLWTKVGAALGGDSEILFLLWTGDFTTFKNWCSILICTVSHHTTRVNALASGGSRISQMRGAPTPEGKNPIIWQYFCWQLHQNERNWTERGHASLAPPCHGSANDVLHNRGAHRNGYSVCVRHFCVLENGGVSECNTGIFQTGFSKQF